MLQHNIVQAGKKAHIAHAAVVSLHTLCCGLPALAMVAAALSGAATGIVVVSDLLAKFHDFMHAHEVWILALSATLVLGGGALELSARWRAPRAGIPWLFAFSALCFVINVAIIAAHRAPYGLG
jgi:hypothetical protein